MSRPTVLLINDNFPKKAIDLLRTRFDLEVCKSSKGDGFINTQDIVDCVPGKFAIFCISSTQINEQIIKAAGLNLKVVATMSVGYDQVDLKSLKKYGVRLGNTPGVLTEVAEIALGLVIVTTRRFFEVNRELKTGGWKGWTQNWMCGRDINGSVVEKLIRQSPRN
ncbi:D-isomer specific 2-hydroxyacid dehydrogenase, catalytic domain [Cinara cedri]|uniref:D-isomer specific 2-hydroxyacid dehydrogenase, catalytic domain n=1 Tax=Cinara cedri TaxID=506608 RepID=A0A5E4MFC9_9HEMI|nr:D-isomer specific 2-hydroxyacid dehydrogenase, catalytic domain [Cinara cedri]